MRVVFALLGAALCILALASASVHAEGVEALVDAQLTDHLESELFDLPASAFELTPLEQYFAAKSEDEPLLMELSSETEVDSEAEVDATEDGLTPAEVVQAKKDEFAEVKAQQEEKADRMQELADAAADAPDTPVIRTAVPAPPAATPAPAAVPPPATAAPVPTAPPAAAPAAPTGPKLVKPKIEEGTVGVAPAPAPPAPVLPVCAKPAAAAAASFLELDTEVDADAEAEVESEVDSETEGEMEFFADAEDELAAEADADSSAEADAEAELDAFLLEAAPAAAAPVGAFPVERATINNDWIVPKNIHVHVKTVAHGGAETELAAVEDRFEDAHQKVMGKLNKLMQQINHAQEEAAVRLAEKKAKKAALKAQKK